MGGSKNSTAAVEVCVGGASNRVIVSVIVIQSPLK
jgi:hypothetical protein